MIKFDIYKNEKKNAAEIIKLTENIIELVEKERISLISENEKKGFLKNISNKRIYYLTRNLIPIPKENLEIIDTFDYFTIKFKEQEIIQLKRKINNWNNITMFEFNEVNLIRKKK